ncbi:MAG: FAD-dependent oxidoreductase [Nitrospirae bacterium]|nr:FAD-dependent oxidoreductase [Nitrospirota bacterium]MBF0590891.1 FAD-dependent oxidoreductase [Nitrospirota bacterium]
MDKVVIHGTKDLQRVSSRMLEAQIQEAVKAGARAIEVIADGQHAIGGRIWPRGETVRFRVEGQAGQRLGSMGMFGTEIVVAGNASDDVGWLNCGATITVLGDVTNGAHNAAAQGRLYVQGSGGARCDTMTKHNPKFDPPESWYLRDVGDTFAEFKAGGIAVVCGVNPRNKKNILGYRPCVGMVGGVVYFRGPITGYSESDVRLLELTDQDWQWLTQRMRPYLEAIDRLSFIDELTASRDDWKKLLPYTAAERSKKRPFKMTIADFRKDIWEKGDKGVGQGGIFAPYLSHPLTVLPYVTSGADRRHKPLWNNQKYAPPCQAYCPSGIPTQRRTALIRAERLHEALELILQYSPLPATVCGEICPNPCMDACTRRHLDRPLNIKGLGKASLDVKAPVAAPKTGKRVAVVGGGPGGLSAAWQLALKGHEVDLYEAEDKLGGKVELCIPRDRLPHEVLTHELERFKSIGINTILKSKVDASKFKEIYDTHDIVVVACGAHRPRKLNIPGVEDTINAYDFLKTINVNASDPSCRPNLRDKRVVIIGAGNVGMDVAASAYACGAKEVTAIDVQKPAASGKELEIAVALGTKVLWPKFTQRYARDERKLYLTDGSSLDADVVIVSVGDTPVTDFLPPGVQADKNGWIQADEAGFTSDPKVYAIGDATRLGLVTHAIGHGINAADAINTLLAGRSYYRPPVKLPIPYAKIKDAYYEQCRDDTFTPKVESSRCMSCAVCRDCHMCEIVCYYGAISRRELDDGSYEYVVDDKSCIGCGFCAGVCPCGIWEMSENI